MRTKKWWSLIMILTVSCFACSCGQAGNGTTGGTQDEGLTAFQVTPASGFCFDVEKNPIYIAESCNSAQLTQGQHFVRGDVEMQLQAVEYQNGVLAMYSTAPDGVDIRQAMGDIMVRLPELDIKYQSGAKTATSTNDKGIVRSCQQWDAEIPPELDMVHLKYSFLNYGDWLEFDLKKAPVYSSLEDLEHSDTQGGRTLAFFVHDKGTSYVLEYAAHTSDLYQINRVFGGDASSFDNAIRLQLPGGEMMSQDFRVEENDRFGGREQLAFDKSAIQGAEKATLQIPALELISEEVSSIAVEKPEEFDFVGQSVSFAQGSVTITDFTWTEDGATMRVELNPCEDSSLILNGIWVQCKSSDGEVMFYGRPLVATDDGVATVRELSLTGMGKAQEFQLEFLRPSYRWEQEFDIPLTLSQTKAE